MRTTCEKEFQLTPLRVAIIGGGISGLAAAWNLKAREMRCSTEITLFESHRHLGGNCATKTFHTGNLFRWCDIGVNDFNTDNYLEVVTIMDLLGVEYKPLEDTACFFKSDNSVVYTIGGPRDVAISGRLAAEYRHFKTYAAADLQKHYAVMSTWTITEYLRHRGYSDDFMNHCILPRVNAMYFCDDDGAPNVPFAAIMSYYVLQEGFGSKVAPKRMYFVNGSQRWIEALAKTLARDYHVTFLTNRGPAIVCPGNNGQSPLLAGLPNALQPFDICILACHADNALESIATPILAEPVKRALETVKYTHSFGVAHTDTRLLPANRNAWRTYNIRIRDNAHGPNRYQMTYVENRHQNDSATIFNHYGLSEFFVSLNPHVQPLDDLVLKDMDDKPIVAWFKHNAVDLATMRMQNDLQLVQGTNNLYFVGGWTSGTGLHIECWTAADAIAERIANRDLAHREVRTEGPTGTMPAYFKRGIEQIEEEAPALQDYLASSGLVH